MNFWGDSEEEDYDEMTDGEEQIRVRTVKPDGWVFGPDVTGHPRGGAFVRLPPAGAYSHSSLLRDKFQKLFCVCLSIRVSVGIIIVRPVWANSLKCDQFEISGCKPLAGGGCCHGGRGHGRGSANNDRHVIDRHPGVSR